MAVLESHMSTVNFQSRLESEIRCLRAKQKEFEARIRRQDETICRLNEDNHLFKAQLSSLTKALINEIPNNSSNKDLALTTLQAVPKKRLPFEVER